MRAGGLDSAFAIASASPLRSLRKSLSARALRERGVDPSRKNNSRVDRSIRLIKAPASVAGMLIRDG
jgi:hypothetical protein